MTTYKDAYSHYQDYATIKRKRFSTSERIWIASRQINRQGHGYMCMGDGCQGEVSLQPPWELDHRVPLFLPHSHNDICVPLTETITYEERFKEQMLMLCSQCHAQKSALERTVFYREERDRRVKQESERTLYYQRASYFQRQQQKQQQLLEQTKTKEAPPVVRSCFFLNSPLSKVSCRNNDSQ